MVDNSNSESIQNRSTLERLIVDFNELKQLAEILGVNALKYEVQN